MTPDQMTPEQLKKFLVYYRKRIEQEPGNVEARLRLATVYRQMEKTPRAIEQYEQAAQLLDDQGLALEAIAACKAILELDPQRMEAQYFLARLYAQTPDATDESARVARPIETADDDPTHELVDEAGEAADTDEYEPRDDSGERERPAPAETFDTSPDGEPTRVADYSELSDEFDWAGEETDEDRADHKKTVELTPEERERRDGFSRQEMQDLLTTIDVDPEEIVDFDDLEDYEFDDEYVSQLDEDSEPDFELGEADEVPGEPTDSPGAESVPQEKPAPGPTDDGAS